MLSSMAERSAIKPALSSVHLYAPACTVSFACKHYASDENVMKRLHLDVLSDKEERDDNVASIYRKSLLYLVSNALETDLRTPILGLDRINDASYGGWDGSSDTGEALATWRAAAKSVGLSSRTTAVTSDLIRVALGSPDATQRCCPWRLRQRHRCRIADTESHHRNRSRCESRRSARILTSWGPARGGTS